MFWLDKQLGLQQELDPAGKVVNEWPTYVCGHCGQTWALNPNRTRPRPKCMRCGWLVCEDMPVCQTECIPQQALFELGFPGELGQRAKAVLDGARTTEEVDRALRAA